MGWKKPYYLEDYANEYDSTVYLPARNLKIWYAKHEISFAKTWLRTAVKTQSVRVQQGLHYNGDGAFERELRRKGIQVHKFELPSTVATRRTHEMVILRRKALENLAKERMHKAREQKRADAPTSWYDETNGPLNPHFLKLAQPSYKANIVDLPAEPVKRQPDPESSERVAML